MITRKSDIVRPKLPPRAPMWTDNPARDAEEYARYLCELREYNEQDEDDEDDWRNEDEWR